MKISKRILISLLILGLLTGTAAISMAEGDASDDAVAVPSGPAAVTGKDEIVYARLSGDGEARGVYVVNHFTLAKGGSFSDYGHYTAVTNLTDLHPLTLADDTVAIRTENENFYYQGDLADDGLPWRYSIRYSLDGADMEPKDLAGASGRLEIHLTSAPNEAIDDTFYLNYMQQITLTLDTDKCANITADGAAPAMAGKSRALAFTILPGNDANITVT
ncbi:MAG: hypothetical protein FWF69_05425, partial [Firmicutes bacterium]|nr:hypothetical protein [Bacillota bacterium]